MTRHVRSVAAIVCVGLMFAGCVGDRYRAPGLAVARDPGLGVVLSCTSWPESQKKIAGVTGPPKPTPDVEDIGVVIHVMLASVSSGTRRKEYEKDFSDQRRWAIAPVDDAVKSTVLMQVEPNKPLVWVDYWTPKMIGVFFGKNGHVNKMWGQYNVRLTLLDIKDCAYLPGTLRPDGLVRDSMPTPQTSTPWRSQLFRSINRLFTEENPRVVHVFLWWSVAEADIDGLDSVTLQAADNNKVWGYSRSAARGGAAVWMGTYGCLTPENNIDYQKRCAKVVAHEIGHSLGLQHVEDSKDNLMYKSPEHVYKDSDIGDKLSLDQQRQARREAMELFGSR